MNSLIGRRAVVIGSGIGGLSAAAVLAGCFMTGVKSIVEQPWNAYTSLDLAFPEARGERPDNFEASRRFEAKLVRAAVTDPTVHRALFQVGQLLQPPILLHEPHMTERIEAGLREQYPLTIAEGDAS
jgi:hypothetical protein